MTSNQRIASRGASRTGALGGTNTAANEPQTTRDKVVNLILHEGELTAAELAERLNLTAAAVRRHLNSLMDEGLICAHDQKVSGQRGRGRPASVYSLTEDGRSRFYQAYDELAIEALTALADALGDEAIEEIAEKRLKNIEDLYLDYREKHPDSDPVEALVAALMETGITATIQPAARGDQLCQHHCPVALVAEKFPQLCEAENKLFSRLLGSHVQRLATIAHGDGVCTLHIPDVPKGPVPVQTPKVRTSNST